jgi:hypothetical protein
MRHCLPLLFAALVAAVPVDVGAQHLFFDTNGDQVCSQLADCYAGTEIPIDVWLDTNHDEYGAEQSCSTEEPLSLWSYELVFVKSAAIGGTTNFGAWSNAIPTFTEDLGRVESGDYLRVGSAGVALPPGKYKLGTLTFTGLGCISLSLSSFPSGAYATGFGSSCPGSRQDNFLRLYEDVGYCYRGCFCSDVRATTWGAIKSKYR